MRVRGGPNEGRIRPSLIAGNTAGDYLRMYGLPTRGEFAPPSLPEILAAAPGPDWQDQRGANSPLPHCRVYKHHSVIDLNATQRGANSPLPHCRPCTTVPCNWSAFANEGRIRPSLIAAPFGACRRSIDRPPNEGRIRPSLIAAAAECPEAARKDGQRGANSPLPHCGELSVSANNPWMLTNEGRIRPSLIAAPVGQVHQVQLGANEGRIRPSLIAA